MAEAYLERPLTRVRRKDRTLDDPAWIDRFLESAAVGHLALAWQGQPLIHSNLFWFDGSAIYLHGAPAGKLRAILDRGPARAAFSVTELGRLLPAGTPMDFSTEYASVIAYGSVRVVADAAECRRALEGLMAKYAPHLEAARDYEPMPDDDVERTTVYRIDLDERVAKHNVKPVDYPAYDYGGGSFIDAERAAGRTTLRPKELA